MSNTNYTTNDSAVYCVKFRYENENKEQEQLFVERGSDKGRSHFEEIAANMKEFCGPMTFISSRLMEGLTPATAMCN